MAEDPVKEEATSEEEDTKRTVRIPVYLTNFLGFLLNFFLHFTLQK
jgi:hypothetical protein